MKNDQRRNVKGEVRIKSAILPTYLSLDRNNSKIFEAARVTQTD